MPTTRINNKVNKNMFYFPHQKSSLPINPSPTPSPKPSPSTVGSRLMSMAFWLVPSSLLSVFPWSSRDVSPRMSELLYSGSSRWVVSRRISLSSNPTSPDQCKERNHGQGQHFSLKQFPRHTVRQWPSPGLPTVNCVHAIQLLHINYKTQWQNCVQNQAESSKPFTKNTTAAQPRYH